MPTREEHLWQADRAIRLANLLEQSDDFADWAVVGLAYAALHLVEGHFADQGEHHQSHASRNRAVRSLLPTIGAPYTSLQDAGRVARYEAAGTLTPRDYEIARSSFSAIKETLRQLP